MQPPRKQRQKIKTEKNIGKYGENIEPEKKIISFKIV